MKAKLEREYEACSLRRKERALMDDEQRELAELRQIEQSIEKTNLMSNEALYALYAVEIID